MAVTITVMLIFTFGLLELVAVIVAVPGASATMVAVFALAAVTRTTDVCVVLKTSGSEMMVLFASFAVAVNKNELPTVIGSPVGTGGRNPPPDGNARTIDAATADT